MYNLGVLGCEGHMLMELQAGEMKEAYRGGSAIIPESLEEI